MHRLSNDLYRLSSEESSCLDKRFTQLFLDNKDFIFSRKLLDTFNISYRDKIFRIIYRWNKEDWVDNSESGSNKRIRLREGSVPIGISIRYRDYSRNILDTYAFEKYSCSEFYNKTMINLFDVFTRVLEHHIDYHNHECTLCSKHQD